MYGVSGYVNVDFPPPPPPSHHNTEDGRGWYRVCVSYEKIQNGTNASKREGGKEFNGGRKECVCVCVFVLCVSYKLQHLCVWVCVLCGC